MWELIKNIIFQNLGKERDGVKRTSIPLIINLNFIKEIVKK